MNSKSYATTSERAITQLTCIRLRNLTPPGHAPAKPTALGNRSALDAGASLRGLTRHAAAAYRYGGNPLRTGAARPPRAPRLGDREARKTRNLRREESDAAVG